MSSGSRRRRHGRAVWRDVASVFLVGRRNALLAGKWPWYIAAPVSMCAIIVMCAPLCIALAYYETTSPDTILPLYGPGYAWPSWPVALAEAYLFTCAPYIAWVAVVFGFECLGLWLDGLPVRPAGRLWMAAWGFTVPYVLLWCIPMSLPYVFLILALVVLRNVPDVRFLGCFYRGITWLSLVAGTILLLWGLFRVRQYVKATPKALER